MTDIQPKLRLRAFEPATVEVAAGVTIDMRVKRLNLEDAASFEQLFRRAVTPEVDRVLLVRRPGDEQDRHPAPASDREDAPLTFGAFIIPDEEIRRRRLEELSAEARGHVDQLRAEDVHAQRLFIDEVLGRFVRVEPGQVEWEDETGAVLDVTNGAQLARCFGASPVVLQRIVLALRSANEVSEVQKNGSGSRFISRPSSPEREPTASGASSAPTAARVDDSGSATTAGATPIAENPSGPTAS